MIEGSAARVAGERGLTLGAVAAALFACALVWRQPEGEFAALLPAAAVVAVVLWQAFRRLSDASLVAAVIFLQLISEEELAFAHMPSVFKAVGELVFTSRVMASFGLNIKGQEVLYVGLAAWIIFKNQRRDGLRFLLDQRFRVAGLMAIAIPGAAVFALLVGQLKGNELGLAATQLHFLLLAPLAFYAGYVACRSPDDFLKVMRAVVAAMVVKAVMAYYAYYVYLGTDLRGREYLIEHWTSDYMATAMLALGACWLAGRKTWANAVASAGLILLIFWPYVLNDRRTAFVGLLFTFLLLPLVFWHRLRLWHLGLVAALVAAFALFIAATWNVPPPVGFLADLIESIVWPAPSALGGIYKYDYRQLENFNLYVGLARDPIFGMGLGTRFPHAVPMADIAKNFELWDAVPHNNMLFTWCFCGPIGMGALGMFTAIGTATGIRLVRLAKTPTHAAIGFLTFSAVVRWIFWVFGDLGLVEIPLFCLINATIGMALKLDQEASSA